MSTTSSIVVKLLDWHAEVDRDMPWKETRDPYKIWLSEVILQQTRVAQGLPYYLNFVSAYPTVADLAAAPSEDVMKLWQGLGYYSRARNMHSAAKTIVEVHGGEFPTDYTDVLALKGIGPYTAAAIVSFAYGLSYPVVDGNVLRVIARLHGILDAVDDTKTLKHIYSLSEAYIADTDPAAYNQAIMDLGALICTPKNTQCLLCPLSEACVAKAKELVSQLPYKAKKTKKTTRHLHYLHVVDDEGNTILHHRRGKGIWQGLCDFPMIETDRARILKTQEIAAFLSEQFGTEGDEVEVSKSYKHILSHQRLMTVFYRVHVTKIATVEAPNQLIAMADIENFAVPVLISNYLKEVAR